MRAQEVSQPSEPFQSFPLGSLLSSTQGISHSPFLPCAQPTAPASSSRQSIRGSGIRQEPMISKPLSPWIKHSRKACCGFLVPQVLQRARAAQGSCLILRWCHLLRMAGKKIKIEGKSENSQAFICNSVP